MALFKDVRTRNNANVFKGLDGLVAVAPLATAALTKTSLFTPYAAGPPVVPGGDLLALPTGWRQVGWMSTDGIGHTRDVSVSETPAWGAAEPILRNVTSALKSLTFTAMESNKTVDELYYMADLTSVTRGTNGVIGWQEPDLPKIRHWRLVAIAKFEAAGGEWYKVDQYPRAMIQSEGDEAWNQDDGGNAKQLRANAQVDDTLGYAVEHFQAGAGWTALTASGY